MGLFNELKPYAGEFGAQLVGLGDALCGELAVGGELGDWWLTYEGERELARLRGLTASRKALRFIKWFLSVVLSGVVLFLLNRLLGEWAA